MKRILIPTDFSETAMNAIRYALELFKYENSEFLIMNAFADDVYENTLEMSEVFFQEYKDKMEDAINRSLRKTIAEIMEISPNPKHNYNYVSKFGTLVDEVNELVDKRGIDVVVMGTKGKTNKTDLTFGSHTLQVMKYVKCPVLAVPVSYHNFPLKTILFPTDYMVPFKRRELKLVASLAYRYAAEVNFIHISEATNPSFRQRDNKKFVSCCFDNVKTNFYQIPGENITEVINGTINTYEADMLVMINHRHSYLENILYHSTIEKIGLEIAIPFLVLQNLPR